MNNLDIWVLPGPGSFLNKVEEELREGNNVIVSFPKAFDLKYIEQMSLRLLESRALNDEITTSSYDGYSPLKILATRFSVKDLSKVQDLLASKELRSKKICMTKIPDAIWSDWKDLVLSHSSALKNSPLRISERPVFLLVVTGDHEMPQNDACLKILKWEGVVTDLDMMLYASEKIEGRAISRFERALIIQTVSDIALWEFGTADAIINADLKDIISPFHLLQTLGNKRKWHGTPTSWENGQIMQYMGNLLESSAFLASRQLRVEQLDIRLWRSQVKVLLPLIEEARRSLIKILGSNLKVPYFIEYGSFRDKITEIEDLELNHIWSQIKDAKGIDDRLKACVNNLKEIRNRLAHFKPLEYTHIENYKNADSLIEDNSPTPNTRKEK